MSNDRRIEWVRRRIECAYKSWIRKTDFEHFDNEDQTLLLKEYFDTRDVFTLYVTVADGFPCISIEPPCFGSKKGLYFLKKISTQVTLDNYCTVLEVGDIHPSPVEALIHAEAHVVPYMLKTKETTPNLTAFERDAVTESVLSFSNQLKVANGLSLGRCHLPLPSVKLVGEAEKNDTQAVCKLEAYLAEWTRQIKTAVEVAPSVLFEKGNTKTEGSPSIQDEISFWDDHSQDLQGIDEQLNGTDILRVLCTLKQKGSSYIAPFNYTREHSLAPSMREARANYIALKALTDIQNSPISEMSGEASLVLDEILPEKTLERFFHCVALLWEQSIFYNTVSRIFMFLLEACNDLISLSRRFISFEQVFMMEPSEASRRIGCALSVADRFKELYFANKVKITNRSEKEDTQRKSYLSNSRGWSMDNNSLFKRYDAFIERCHDILDVLDVTSLFNLLDPEQGRVVVGGSSGHSIGRELSEIYITFCKALNDFSDKGNVDLFDVADLTFDARLDAFKEKQLFLEKKLGVLVGQALNEAPSLANCFKIVDTFERLIVETSAPKQKWLAYQDCLVEQYHADLLETQEIFRHPTSSSELTIHSNASPLCRLPPLTEVTFWCQMLVGRIESPSIGFNRFLSTTTRESRLWRTCEVLADSLKSEIERYKAKCETQFTTHAVSVNTELTLHIFKVIDGEVVLNFSDTLSSFMKDFIRRKDADTPTTSLEDADTLRTRVTKLSNVCAGYNTIIKTSSTVERGILSEALEVTGQIISRGVEEICWDDDGIDGYIEEISHMVEKMGASCSLLARAKVDILKQLRTTLEDEKLYPFEGKDLRTKPIDVVHERYSIHRQVVYRHAFSASASITEIITTTFNHLASQNIHTTPFTPTSPSWTTFLRSLNEVIAEKVISGTHRTLVGLRNSIDAICLKENGGVPLVDIKLTVVRDSSSVVSSSFLPKLSASRIEFEALPTSPADVNAVVQEEKNRLNDIRIKIAGLLSTLYGSRKKNVQGEGTLESTTISQTLREMAKDFTVEEYVVLWVEDIAVVANVFDKVDSEKDESLLASVVGSEKICEVVDSVFSALDRTLRTLTDFKKRFDKYSYLFENKQSLFEVLRSKVYLEDTSVDKESTTESSSLKAVDRAESMNSSNSFSVQSSADRLHHDHLQTNIFEIIEKDRTEQKKQKGRPSERSKGSSAGSAANERTILQGQFENDFFKGGTLAEFSLLLSWNKATSEQIADLPDGASDGCVRVDSKPLKASLGEFCMKRKTKYTDCIVHNVKKELMKIMRFSNKAIQELEANVSEGDIESLKRLMRWVGACKARHSKFQSMIEPLHRVIDLLKGNLGNEIVAELEGLWRSAPALWVEAYQRSLTLREKHASMQFQEADRLSNIVATFREALTGFLSVFEASPPFGYLENTEAAYDEIDLLQLQLQRREQEATNINEEQTLFDVEPAEFLALHECRTRLVSLKWVWDTIAHTRATFNNWLTTPFCEVNIHYLTEEVSKLQKVLRCPTSVKKWPCYEGIQHDVKEIARALPILHDIKDEALRDRHWKDLLRETGQNAAAINIRSTSCSLQDLLKLKLHDHAEIVEIIVERAIKELSIENALHKISTSWTAVRLSYLHEATLGTWVLGSVENIMEMLESDANTLQQMQSNRFVEYFEEKVNTWMQNLAQIETTLQAWTDVQKRWANLHPIFIGSSDIADSLPEQSQMFLSADELFRKTMEAVKEHTSIIGVCCSGALERTLERDESLEEIIASMGNVLAQCEKSLSDYLEEKKTQFPRFYFLADSDLVDVLSKGTDPQRVMVHMSKIVDAISTFKFVVDPHEVGNGGGGGGPTKKTIYGFESIQGEFVKLCAEYTCTGGVEYWLSKCVEVMQGTIRDKIEEANSTYMEQPRVSWVFNHCCQAVVAVSRLQFGWDTTSAFALLEDGNESAMRDHLKSCQRNLNEEIKLVVGQLRENDRVMLVHLITVDVHNRDVVQGLIDERADNETHFMWQSQLRYIWDEAKGCTIRLCDTEFVHGYEYVGLCGCLVVTRLTHRCYITLTQALKLAKGGAPAGPAGTGKTETVKDLARNLGAACYVFNCSDLMSHTGLGQIFKGLAMTGCWGCFDEFNRISVEVLSVVSIQVSSVQKAIRTHKSEFKFANEDDITLRRTCGIFITMNPDYAGRTELPENIKSLFIPCAMVVPDVHSICEILLAAEGFEDAKDLALKFVQLYRLNKELLSQQKHYDWGLRAIKSVLLIAGHLKRTDPDLNERLILLRALRDSNLAKLARDDMNVFRSLIQALFPGMQVEKKVDATMYEDCLTACSKLNNLPGENNVVIDKCLQLHELLSVRHSAFVLGRAGCGKTTILQTTGRALSMKDNCRLKCRWLNPKAITTDEMYGCTAELTREWRDGHLSRIFKDFSNLSKTNACWKWIILDGVIDTDWIESMNTVMDDNKMLTLPNSDRIPLTSTMRMLFEISHLDSASPATVSRAGILYINDGEIGWAPYKDRWLLSIADEKERACIDTIFEQYLPALMEQVKKAFVPIVPVVDICFVQTVCSLMQAFMTAVPQGTPTQYEHYAVFALIWAFGGTLPSDGRIDYRSAFNRWWVQEMQSRCKVADETHDVFDMYIAPETGHQFTPWADLVPAHKPPLDAPFHTLMVDTAETVRMGHMIELLAKQQRGVLVVGTVGTGKSVCVNNVRRKFETNEWMSRFVSFHAHTKARVFQSLLEQPTERAGRMWYPFGRKKLLFLVDDINMPLPDKFGTQESLAFMRQYLDHGFWFERSNAGVERSVSGIQFLAAMNHKAGSFTMSDRLQRWFSVLALSSPSGEDLTYILSSLLMGHLKGWSDTIHQAAASVISATVELQQQIKAAFPPSAKKFLYHWNMRDVTQVVQGMMLTSKVLHDGDVPSFLRLFCHECDRTYKDRLDQSDVQEYDALVAQTVKRHFHTFAPEETILAEPNLWGPFGQQGDDGEIYDSIDGYDQLAVFLESKLEEYNEETNRPALDLVLFVQAMDHITRVSRVLSRPKGNLLLIGVGGSGKRSISRMATFITELEYVNILVTAHYNGDDFRHTIKELYEQGGRRGLRFALLITDAQIVCPDQLVVLSDILTSGHIPGLFEPDEKDELSRAMIPELRQRQQEYNKEVCWEYLVSKVQMNLHTILCFSPVGKHLDTWCRHFPALVCATVVDWFHPWPLDALTCVSQRFLEEDIPPEARDTAHLASLAAAFSSMHMSASRLAEDFRRQQRRRCYNTPKTFMELVLAYKRMLEGKKEALSDKMDRLVDGLFKINHAKEQVDSLQKKLVEEDVEVRAAAAEVCVLMEQISTDKAACQEEAERGETEKIKTEKLWIETDALRADAERDLAAAQPMVERAKEALKGLNKASLTELKSFTKPPQDVLMVTAAVMCLVSAPNKIPRMEKAKDWGNAKKMMANVSSWIKELEEFANRAHSIPQACVDSIQVWVRDPEFDAENMRSKSEAAACLASWVTNMDAYHNLRCQIRPKEERLYEATLRLDRSRAQFQRVQEHVAGLNEKLNNLIEAHNAATERSRLLKQQAETTRLKMNVAERLVAGLAEETIRWGATLEGLQENQELLTGNVLMAAAFISYAGPFDGEHRARLMTDFRLILDENAISVSPTLDVVTEVLTTEAEIAAWNNEGLPTDRVSTENGAIVKNAKRWPLLVDPQLQGVGWIKAREEANGLMVVQQNDSDFLDKVVFCMEEGLPCLVENLPEQIDPILDPLLSKEFSKKAASYICEVGDRDVEVDITSFRLYLQTKHPNPHYRPELHAQTTVVNFMVTDWGLQEQLLGVVVNKERPELEEKRVAILRKLNQYKIDLAECEDRLLFELSNAKGDLLKNVVLITNLEETKKQAGMISKSLVEDRKTQEELIVKRLAFQPAAARGSLLYFEIVRLTHIDYMYQYSLGAFMSVFMKALDRAEPCRSMDETVEQFTSPDDDAFDINAVPQSAQCTVSEKRRVSSLLAAITEEVCALPATVFSFFLCKKLHLYL